MILVQNHPRQLSGSRWNLIALLCIILFSSCGIFSNNKKPDPKTPTTHRKVENKAKKVDTVRWDKISELEYPPIQSDGSIDGKQGVDTLIKRPYRVASFIPFETNKLVEDVRSSSELHNINYIHYYAGMKLAMEELEREGVEITLDVYDSKESTSQIENILQNQLNQDVDLILGPFKKESLSLLAEFGKINQIPVVSPWLTSRSVTKENPFYIQLRPYLIEHYYRIVTHALNDFKPEQIYLLSKNDARDISRLQYFQEKAEEITGQQEPLQTFIFEESKLNQEASVFRSRIQSDTTVFIIPNYSSKDETLIYNILRRLNVEKGNKTVVVYAMPVAYTMDKMTYDFYHNLNLRICMSRFVDKHRLDNQNFIQRYYERYHDFPLEDAFEGYDNMLFVGRQLHKNGIQFYSLPIQTEDEYLSVHFQIYPIFGKAEDNELNFLEYYENKSLQIIEYQGDHFAKSK